MTARRTAVLAVSALLVLGGTSACGLRDRGAADAVPASSPAQRAERPDQAASPADEASSAQTAAAAQDAAQAAKPPKVTEAQVRTVESVVGAAAKVVSQGEAEVASDG